MDNAFRNEWFTVSLYLSCSSSFLSNQRFDHSKFGWNGHEIVKVNRRSGSYHDACLVPLRCHTLRGSLDKALRLLWTAVFSLMFPIKLVEEFSNFYIGLRIFIGLYPLKYTGMAFTGFLR